MPARLGVPGRYAVVTLHRPSNVDAPARLAAVVAFLERTAAELDIVFPVHPRTAARLRELGLRARLDAAPRIRVLEPLGYRENLGLMAGATVVISDSGGIQEETTYLGVPCVTLRPNTERPVTVTSGTNTVVGEDLDAAWAVVAEIRGPLQDRAADRRLGRARGRADRRRAARRLVTDRQRRTAMMRIASNRLTGSAPGTGREPR